MKKTLLFGLVFAFMGFSHQVFAQSSDASDQQDITPATPPYLKSMSQQAIQDMKSFALKDKEKIMDSLNKSFNYTEDEYQTLYNNYESNPPFIEKNGVLELNPDYISKNTKYIRKDGKLVKNEDYQPNINHEKIDITKIINIEKEPNRLGKKSYSINPDVFY